MHKHPSAVSSGWRDWIVVRMYVQGGWRVCVCVCVLFCFCGAANFLLMGKGFGGIQPIEKLIKL